MKRDLDTILSFTIKDGDCMVWTRCCNTDGYPRAVIDKDNNAKVHRVVYELYNKCSVKGYVVRHTCDNPLCINPMHLLIGSPQDNVKDMDERGRRFRVITKEVIREVKSLYSLKLYSQKRIAEIVGIDARRVSDILNNVYNDDGCIVHCNR